jgi:antitoxin (DNA-binding transcriptional repressor) of toxin-antitoxin stability system
VGRGAFSETGQIDNVATGGYFRSMRAVGIKVLKNKLSQYIRMAADGETVLVTDRDRVVAEIGPPRAGRADEIRDAVLADAVREGWVTPPPLRSTEMPRDPVASLAELLEELDESRSER